MPCTWWTTMSATFDGSTTKTVEGVGNFTGLQTEQWHLYWKIIRRNCTSCNRGSWITKASNLHTNCYNWWYQQLTLQHLQISKVKHKLVNHLVTQVYQWMMRCTSYIWRWINYQSYSRRDLHRFSRRNRNLLYQRNHSQEQVHATVKHVDKNGTPITATTIPTKLVTLTQNQLLIGKKGQNPNRQTNLHSEGWQRVTMNDNVPAILEDGSTTKTIPGVGTYTVAADGTVTFTPEPELLELHQL